MTEKVNEELMESVIKQMKEDNIKFIRLQFVDINGTVKYIVIPFKLILSEIPSELWKGSTR